MKTKATIEDLHRIDGKAEIVNGEIVRMSPTGGKTGRAGGKIFAGLERYERETTRGYAFPDNVGFRVDLPRRSSFSPDAAFYSGSEVSEDFLDGAPIFAAEVRSKNDYGDTAEQKITEKIADYFRAGTLVVWDVDVLRERVVRVYRASDPSKPTVYGPGEIAEAEPALPGWRLAVDRIFS